MTQAVYSLLFMFFINVSDQRPLLPDLLELQPDNHRIEIKISQLYYSNSCQVTVSVTEPSEFSIEYVHGDNLFHNDASVYDHISLVTSRIRREISSDVIEIFGKGVANNFTVWRIQRHKVFNGSSHIFHSVSLIKVTLVSPKCSDFNRDNAENSLNTEGWNGKLVLSVFRLNCSLPDEPEFGNINGTYEQNGTIEFECVSSFVLRGRKYLSCVQNRSGVYVWNGRPPRCVQDTCPVEEIYEPKVNTNQIIATPGYPTNITFTRNRTCSWKLIPKDNHYCIDVTIIEVDLPQNNKTYFRIFEIVDNSTESEVFSSSFSSLSYNRTLTTCGKGLAIYYQSNYIDDGVQYRGVYLWYTSRPDTMRYTMERYRTGHQTNVSQTDGEPTRSTTDTEPSESGGSKSGIIAAGVLVPLFLVFVVTSVIFYIWYRKKYPVRMIIGKDFGKFTNPAYEKRHSTATLTREHDSFEKEIEKMAAATGVAHDNPVDLSDETDFHREYQPMTTQTTLLRNMGYTKRFDLTDDGCSRDSLTYNSTTKRKKIHPDINLKDDNEENSEDETDGKSNFLIDTENQLKNVEKEKDKFDEISMEKSGDNSSSSSDGDSDGEGFQPLKGQPNIRRKRVSAYLNEVLDGQISENYTTDDSSQSEEVIVDERQNKSAIPEEDENNRETNKSTDEVDENETHEINPKDSLNGNDIYIYENAVIVGDSKMDKPVILPFTFQEATDEDMETAIDENNSELRKRIEPVRIRLDDSSEEMASSSDDSVHDDEPNSYSFIIESDCNIPEDVFIEETKEYTPELISEEKTLALCSISANRLENHLEEQFSQSENLEKQEKSLRDSEKSLTKTFDTGLIQIDEDTDVGNILDLSESQSPKVLNNQNNDNLLPDIDNRDVDVKTTINAKRTAFKTLSSYPSVSLDGGSMESLASVEYAEFERSDIELPSHTTEVSFSSKGDVIKEVLPIDVLDFTKNGVSDFLSEDSHLSHSIENSEERFSEGTTAEQNVQKHFVSFNDNEGAMTTEENDNNSVTALEGADSNTTDSDSKEFAFKPNKQHEDNETTSEDAERILSFYDDTSFFDNTPSDQNQVSASSFRLQQLLLDVPTLCSDVDGGAIEAKKLLSFDEDKSDDEKPFDSQDQLPADLNIQGSVTLDNPNFDLLNTSQYSKRSPSKLDELSEGAISGRRQSITLNNSTSDLTNTPSAKSADDALRVIRFHPSHNDVSPSSNSSCGESESDAESENKYKKSNNEQDNLLSGFGESTDDVAVSVSFDQNKMDEINGIKIIPAVNLMDLQNPAKKEMEDSDESDISIHSDVINEAGVSSDSDSEPTLTSGGVSKQSSFKITLSPELHSGDNDSVDV